MKHRMVYPLPYAGCYDLHLYCDHANDAHDYDEFPHEFTGQTLGVCAKAARSIGWIIHRNCTATCPKCSR